MIRNLTRGTLVATEEVWAQTIQERTRGLLDWDGIEAGQALVISPCKSIHMFGMRFPIDLLFVRADGVVLRAIEGIKPWRLTRIYFTARHTIELPVGAIAASSTEPGDQLELDPPASS
ncbi:MAG: DUF192 domain-containing protein [Myxococcota bacterium]|nr:DUF192 domain-containing protein [Myxococcota bacterium]